MNSEVRIVMIEKTEKPILLAAIGISGRGVVHSPEAAAEIFQRCFEMKKQDGQNSYFIPESALNKTVIKILLNNGFTIIRQGEDGIKFNISLYGKKCYKENCVYNAVNTCHLRGIGISCINHIE